MGKKKESTERQSSISETVTVTVETWVFSSAFYFANYTLFNIFHIKRYNGFFHFLASLFGWMLTKRAAQTVNSHQWVILAVQLFPAVLHVSQGTP